MKTIIKSGGGAQTLLLILWSFLLPTLCDAQLSGSGGGGGITGPTEVQAQDKDSQVKESVYQHMFEGDQYFWRVKGAISIQGQPASTWPGGNVPDDASRQITIAWDSVDIGVIQLRQGTAEASEVVAELQVAVGLGGNCDGRIFYNGQGSANLGWNITGDVYLCPTTVQNTQLHKFEFNRNCAGDNQGKSTRPRYIWTVKYKTASGGEYQEQWQNEITVTKQPEILLRLYDVVPRTRYQAINSEYTPWNYTPLNPEPPIPNAGESITQVRIEVSGYSCGFSLAPVCGMVSKVINVYYYPPKPARPVVSASGTLCRSQSYSVSVPSIPQATRYQWSATGGATISGTGSTATLYVGSATLNTVQVQVTAYNDNAPCRKNSEVSDPVNVNLQPVPAAPQNLQLTGDLCPSGVGKLITVDPVSGATNYRWRVSGSGAGIGNPTLTEVILNSNSTSLYLPQNGPVTLSVQALNDCGGISAATTQAFAVGNTALPACPSSLLAGYQCDGTDLYRVAVPNPAFGIQYSFAVRNIQPSNAQVQVVRTTASSVSYLLSNNLVSFDVRLLLNGCADFDVCGPFTLTPGSYSCRGTGRVGVGALATSASTRFSGAEAVRVAPNPTTGEVQLIAAGGQVFVRAELISVQGALVLTQQTSGKEASISRLDLRVLPAGLYTLRLYDGHSWSSQRVVKE